jgi:L-asparaginase
MKFMSGRSEEDFIMLQGGAGPMDPTRAGLNAATDVLKRVAQSAVDEWKTGEAIKLAQLALEGMENDEGFNAGRGSALQRDGIPRLSAALMDGKIRRFSGVISISDVMHPSRLALVLQKRSARVLTGPGHDLLARELKEPVADLITAKRFDRWLESRRDNPREGTGADTVGVVVSFADGVVAGTSTGGRGNEEPGRVSDSATVAGNYASEFAAISLTGIGEQIVDDGVAVRIETRVRDGMSLEIASKKTYEEALAAGHQYGWIACDRKGNWTVAHTTDAMTYLVRTLSGEILAWSHNDD